MKTLLVLYFLMVCLPGTAEDFYTNYITANIRNNTLSTGGPSLSPKHMFLPDKDGVEFLPAERFSQGNWGNAVLGFRVSLRLDKMSCGAGESIIGTVIIRNSNHQHMTNQMMQYMRFDSALDNGPAIFKVCDSSGKFLDSFADQSATKALAITHGAWVPTGRDALLEPGTQDKYAQRLDAQFSLVSGEYQVFATFKIPAWKIISPDGKKIRDEPWIQPPRTANSNGEKREFEMLEVKSSPVPLKII